MNAQTKCLYQKFWLQHTCMGGIWQVFHIHCLYMCVAWTRFPHFFSTKWQDENSIDLLFHAPRSGQASQTHPKPISNNGEVEVLRMVAECSNKFDYFNFNRDVIEITIRDKLEDALVEDLKGEASFCMNNNEGSDGEMKEMNDHMEKIRSTMDNKVPTNIDQKFLLHEAETPLHAGSPLKRLTLTLMLLVWCTTFAIPNNFVDELLKLLKETIVPKDNTLPKSFYEAKCLLMMLGLSYNSIHVCRGGCCLFWKDLEDATRCPRCHKLRYVDNSKTSPIKFLRYYSLIPRLQWMYSCTRLVELMKWHVGWKLRTMWWGMW